MHSIESIPENEYFKAEAHLYRYIYSHINGTVLKCAVQLDNLDIIHNHGQPIAIPQLISKLEVHPTKTACVERLVRFLVHNGFLLETKVINEEEEENEAYTLTPSKLLVKGMESNLAPIVGLVETGFMAVFDFLASWFKGNNKTIAEIAFGVGMWEILEHDPLRLKSFNEAMVSDSQMITMVLKDFKSIFKGLESIVDVGGGTGTTCRIICEAYPNLKCIVFDLSQFDYILSFVGGSMFESIPFADVVLLKWILHNWDDESSMKILNNCKEAITKKGKGGKVIIIDAVIKEKEDDDGMTQVKLLFDISMMSTLNGKERTEKEWKKLLEAAGFKHYKITPLFGFRSIIEAYP